MLTVPHSGKPGMPAVTFVQVLPASRVTCTQPVVGAGPDQPLLAFGDSAIAKTVQ